MIKRKVINKHYQFTEYEYARLKELTDKSGRKEVDVIRDLILDGDIIEAPGAEFYEAINQIRAVGVNINQIAHIANATGVIDAEAYRKEAEKLDKLAAELKRIAMQPSLHKDRERLDTYLEYAVFETIPEDMECLRIRQEIKDLFDGTFMKKRQGVMDGGNDEDLADQG